METPKRHFQQDFLKGSPGLAPFYPANFPELDWKGIAEKRLAVPVDRETVAWRIEQQYLAHGIPDGYFTLLRSPNTLTVTTGHQVCLMGGPLFMLLKAATTVKLAREISKRVGHPVMPVFWMASEDHDWEEMNHFFSGFGKKIQAEGSGAGAVGRRVVDAALVDLLGKHCTSPLREVYAPGRTWAEAFRALLERLFGPEGLMVIDGDDPHLKRLFIPVMRRELEFGDIEHAVRETTEALEGEGYPAVIHTRPTQLFYLDGAKSRFRIDRLGKGRFQAGAREWGLEDLLAELESSPERFSPNVAMRPLYQETLLPNLAYVGGWAELGYWGQLSGAFSVAGLPMPALIPRMSAAFLTADQADRWAHLGFSPSDFEKDTHRLFERYLPKLWTSLDLEAYSGNVLAGYEALAQYMESLDPTLSRHIRALQTQAQRAFEKLPGKAAKAVRNRYPTAFREIERLKDQVQPDGLKQERVLNFSALPLPEERLVRMLIESCDPLHYQSQWIILP